QPTSVSGILRDTERCWDDRPVAACLVSMVMETEPRALCMPGKHSAISSFRALVYCLGLYRWDQQYIP
ncbi:mCG145522, partial [Mus musculus]